MKNQNYKKCSRQEEDEREKERDREREKKQKRPKNYQKLVRFR